MRVDRISLKKHQRARSNITQLEILQDE